MKGLTRLKGAVASKLCWGAAQAALAGRTDASFDRLCAALAELAADAVPGSSSASKDAALCLLSKAGFAEVARTYDGDMLSVFNALQQQLGWSPQQAAAALLQGIGQDRNNVPDDVRDRWEVSPMPNLCSLLNTTAQHIEDVASLFRSCGLEGSELALATQTARAAWASMPVDKAEVIANALVAAGLPPIKAVKLWLACGSAAASAAFLAGWQQITACGTPREQVDELATAIIERQVLPGTFATGMAALSVLYADWAAVPVAATANRPMLPAPSDELQHIFEQLRAAGCSPQQLLQLIHEAIRTADGGASYSSTFSASLAALYEMLGSWTAAAEAALENDLLLQLKAPPDGVMQYCRQLRAEGASQQQLRQVANLLLQIQKIEGASFVGLLLLEKLLGSREAALEAAASDVRLLRLPTGAEAEETANQLYTAGIQSEQLIQLLSAELRDRQSSPTLFSSLRLLNELLGGWQAAVDAALTDGQLLHLPAASPLTLGMMRQLRDSGLSLQQLVALFSKVCATGRQEASFHEKPFAGLRNLRLLLGSWRAAGEAVLLTTDLLRFPVLTAEQQGISANLAASGLSQVQMMQLMRLLSSTPTWLNGKLKALETASLLLGGDWRAAAEAIMNDSTLLNLPPCCEAADEIVQQLDSGEYFQLQRLRLARAIARSPHQYHRSLRALATLFGSWHAAIGAVLEDTDLLTLRIGDDMQVAIRHLSEAGLQRRQLLQLAQIAAELRYDGSDKLRAMAERLYGGDWKAASLRFLERRTLQYRLCCLEPILDRLDDLGFAVANQQGRDFVLDLVEGRRHKWQVSIPDSTPASERQAAAEAALEQQGFEAAGSKARKLLQQLAEEKLECFGFEDDHRSWRPGERYRLFTRGPSASTPDIAT